VKGFSGLFILCLSCIAGHQRFLDLSLTN